MRHEFSWKALIVMSFILLAIHGLNHSKEKPTCIQLDTGTKGLKIDNQIVEGGTLRDITVDYKEIDCG